MFARQNSRRLFAHGNVIYLDSKLIRLHRYLMLSTAITNASRSGVGVNRSHC
jgi:hypothetical protein